MASNQTVFHQVYGSGMPLVLLHGWGWHSNIWQPIVPKLAKHFQVILVDLPGFGKSSLITTEYTLENIARQILNSFPGTAHWLGWSMGGLITSWIAAHYPQHMKKHILVTSTPCFVQSQNWPGMSPELLDEFSQKLMTNCEQTLNDFLLLQAIGSPKYRDLIRQLRAEMFKCKPNMAALQYGLSLLRQTDLRDTLVANSPNLYIFGNNDAIVPVTVIEAIRLLSPHSYFSIIKEAGHLPFLSHPQDFLTLMIDFLIE
jgi:pimeloyl-[acyl-carrier protein] methyl ester esterase